MTAGSEPLWQTQGDVKLAVRSATASFLLYIISLSIPGPRRTYKCVTDSKGFSQREGAKPTKQVEGQGNIWTTKKKGHPKYSNQTTTTILTTVYSLYWLYMFSWSSSFHNSCWIAAGNDNTRVGQSWIYSIIGPQRTWNHYWVII